MNSYKQQKQDQPVRAVANSYFRGGPQSSERSHLPSGLHEALEASVNLRPQVRHVAQLQQMLNPQEKQVVQVRRNVNDPPVQRVAYGAAPSAFDQFKEQYGGLEDKFDKLRAESEAEPERAARVEIRERYARLWTDSFKKPFPADPDLRNLKGELNEKFQPDFDNLKIITDLPSTLSGDIAHVDIGVNIDYLKARLEARELPETGAGFLSYINRQLLHFRSIRQKLVTEPELLSKLWGGDISTMSVAFRPLGADEHGFAPPTRLDLRDQKGSINKSLVYKDRPGEVDKMVTDLFARINPHLEGRARLPAYQQEIFRDKTLLSEFVSGLSADKKVSYLEGVGNAVARLTQNREHADRYTENIRLLEAVAKEIGLTDLHEENLIIDEENQRIVPIDLEAFSSAVEQQTGLYGNTVAPDTKELMPPSAYRHIQDFKSRLDDVERRLVPVPTGDLHNMLERGGVDQTVSRIKESLERNKFAVDVSALIQYVDACKHHTPMAIPSFTVKQGVVFSSALAGQKIPVANAVR